MASLILIFLGYMLVLVVTTAISARITFALHRAHQQRMDAIIARTFRPISHGQLSKAMEAVPFGKHIKAVFWGRDPWALYDPIVRDSVVNPVVEVMGPSEFHEMMQANKPTVN